MTTNHLTEVLANTIKASGIPGLKATPTMVARSYGVPREQARLALRRLARRGLLAGGRTTS